MSWGESERREFTRLRHNVGVRYKFISSSIQGPDIERVHDGTTGNLSIGGLLLVGPIPDLGWLRELLVGRMHLGVNVAIPPGIEPIKALTRVAWIEAVDDAARGVRLGLRIQEMPADHRRRLSEFLVKETAT